MKLFIQRRIKSVCKWKRSSCNVESSRWASGREVLATSNQVGGQVEEKFLQRRIKSVGKWKRSSSNKASRSSYNVASRSFVNVASSRCASARDCLSRQLNMNVTTSPSNPTPPPNPHHQLPHTICNKTWNTNENWQERRGRYWRRWQKQSASTIGLEHLGIFVLWFWYVLIVVEPLIIIE